MERVGEEEGGERQRGREGKTGRNRDKETDTQTQSGSCGGREEGAKGVPVITGWLLTLIARGKGRLLVQMVKCPSGFLPSAPKGCPCSHLHLFVPAWLDGAASSQAVAEALGPLSCIVWHGSGRPGPLGASRTARPASCTPPMPQPRPAFGSTGRRESQGRQRRRGAGNPGPGCG